MEGKGPGVEGVPFGWAVRKSGTQVITGEVLKPEHASEAQGGLVKTQIPEPYPAPGSVGPVQ